MNNLPNINDLYESKELISKTDQFNTLMNQPPKKSWIKKNKFANGALYLPIERVEWLLISIFKIYRVEVREVKQLFNGVSCTVRLHYFHPVSGEWEYFDGVGADQIQTNSGSSPADLKNIKNNAVKIVVGIAKTEAVKNAAKSLGKLFGRDLNREQNITYESDSTLVELTPDHPNWNKCIEAVQSGKYSVQDIADKYNISSENKTKLQNG